VIPELEADVGDGPIETAPDRELWERTAYDDHGAFTELFERHAKAVWNYAYRLTASWSSAEDLLSTVFLTVWHRRGDIVLVNDSALPWLYTVTANLAHNEYRRRNRFLRLVPKLAVAETSTDHAERIAEHDDTRTRLAATLAAVDRLPSAEREVVRLCLIGEVSTADAAQLLKISEVSVRSRLSRARNRLRKLTLENHDD
jgi:RNA polymerase sigma-70 factor, ECF subfamily